MADFSGGAAIASGFRLIGRKPGAVLAWGVAYVLLAVAPQILMMWAILPDLMNFYRELFASAQAGGAPPTSNPEFLRLQAEINRFQPLQIVLSIVSLAIVNSAIYRAVLEPENGAFGYLRLGAQELWVGLTTVVLYIVVIVAAVAAIIPVAVIGAVSAQGASWGAGLLVFLLACGAFFFIVWIWLRLSLALPMSFAQKNFRLFESWAMTRGLGWKLFGVALAVIAIVLAVELVLLMVVIAVVGATGVAQSGQLNAFFQHPPADLMARAIPWLVGVAVLYSVLAGVMFAILSAPFAEIYREITGSTDAKVF